MTAFRTDSRSDRSRRAVSRVTARAPGKIIVTGEYAVMRGAPAVVLAVDRYARVTVTRDQAWNSGSRFGEPAIASCGRPLRDRRGTGFSGCTVRARDLGIECAEFELVGTGVRWRCAEPRLGLVEAVVDELLRAPNQTSRSDAATGGAVGPPALADRWSGLRIELDTGEFFAPGGKLGLGSSAALTVALAGALAAAVGQPTPTLARLVAIHRALQGGRGSGFDIAAARCGGTFVYRDDAAGPVVTPIDWPDGLSWAAVFSGRSGATAPLLAEVAAWARRQPCGAAELFARMTAVAERGAEHLVRANAAAERGAEHLPPGRPANAAAGHLESAIAQYRELMIELGARSGADIVGEDHARLMNLAERSGVLYKACGAGGGDLGVALATDATRLAGFTAGASTMGYAVPAIGPACSGLTVTDV
jgi:phosphomevalonate kinase